MPITVDQLAAAVKAHLGEIHWSMILKDAELLAHQAVPPVTPPEAVPSTAELLSPPAEPAP